MTNRPHRSLRLVVTLASLLALGAAASAPQAVAGRSAPPSGKAATACALISTDVKITRLEWNVIIKSYRHHQDTLHLRYVNDARQDVGTLYEDSAGCHGRKALAGFETDLVRITGDLIGLEPELHDLKSGTKHGNLWTKAMHVKGRFLRP